MMLPRRLHLARVDSKRSAMDEETLREKLHCHCITKIVLQLQEFFEYEKLTIKMDK